MNRQSLAKLAIFAIFAVPLVVVVLSTWRFRLASPWRMDPIPFAFFVAVAYGAGWLAGARRSRGSRLGG